MGQLFSMCARGCVFVTRNTGLVIIHEFVKTKQNGEKIKEMRENEHIRGLTKIGCYWSSYNTQPHRLSVLHTGHLCAGLHMATEASDSRGRLCTTCSSCPESETS